MANKTSTETRYDSQDYNEKNVSEAGKIIKAQRESHGISRPELSLRTRISVNVIQALENGWILQLPEKQFLKRMILILEKELSIEDNILSTLIISEYRIDSNSKNRFYFPISPQIFTTWIGSLIYILVLSISILIINRYQSYLSKNNVQTVSPIINTK